MAENSSIEWTTHTFNPWIGCTKISPACDHCYAETWDKRFHGGRWGPHATRTRTSAGNWKKPIKWNKAAGVAAERRRVFCASLADVFDNHRSICQSWRDDLWRLIYETKNLDWLLLTKRPQNIEKFKPANLAEDFSHVWLGVTAENQVEANRRVPVLLNNNATVRFLSIEPMLEPIRIARLEELDWVIVGGESGHAHRPMNAQWVRQLRNDCRAAKVKFLLKQWPGPNRKAIKAAGRELDGVVHNDYPSPTSTRSAFHVVAK